MSSTPPIRVLHVLWSIDPSKGTGPAEALRALALEQAKLGLRVTIITADALGAIDAVAAPLREAGVVVRPTGPARGPLSIGKNSLAVVRKVLEGGIDVVHIHGMWQHLPHLAAREARAASVPYIMRSAGMLEPWALRKGRLKKRLHRSLISGRDLQNAAALQATSYVEGRNLINLNTGAPVAVVSHGVDFDPRPPTRRDDLAEARWPILKGTRRLLFLGRIDPVKGTMPLAEAWGRVAKDFPDWRLVIAGPDWDSHRKDFESSLAARGVLDRTIFTGSVRGNDKRILLSSCDLFVQPSFQENFGITIAEALAAGRPVITTKATPWQVLGVRGAGWWIDLGADPLEKALREAMSLGRDTLDEMGRKGPWIIEERASWPRIARRLNALYEWLAGRTERPDFVYDDTDQMPEGWGAWGEPDPRHRRPDAWELPLPRLSIPLCSPAVSETIVRYALMLAIVFLAVLARWAIDPWVKDRLSLFLAYAAVAVCTLLLGVRAGLAALVLGYLLNSLFFIEPRGTLVTTGTIDLFKIFLYAGAGLATCLVAAWIHGRERAAREREWMAEARIAAQAADLARSNAELERFAEMIARDLKEPLRGLSGNARRLLDGDGAGLSEPGRTAASSMERQSRRAITLVDSLLELAQAGRHLNLTDVNLSEVLDDVLEDLAPIIAETGGEVVRQQLPVARCDRVQVSRILKILIGNGLLHNASDRKRIEIGLAGAHGPRSNGAPAIFVRDNGVGIEPDDRERVFELFSRLRTDSETGGTGLALVKRLVQVHGGVVWVESRPGIGSTFYFTLQGPPAPRTPES